MLNVFLPFTNTFLRLKKSIETPCLEINSTLEHPITPERSLPAHPHTSLLTVD